MLENGPSFYPELPSVVTLTVKNPHELLRLQTHLVRQIEGFVPYPEGDLHLSLLYHGKPHQMHRCLKEGYPQISFKDVMSEMEHFVNDLGKVEVPETVANGIHVGVFGEYMAPVVVLAVEVEEAVREARRQIFIRTLGLLKDLGVRDIPHFLHTCDIFRFNPSEEFQPHITLGRFPRNSYGYQMPLLPYPMKVELAGI